MGEMRVCACQMWQVKPGQSLAICKGCGGVRPSQWGEDVFSGWGKSAAPPFGSGLWLPPEPSPPEYGPGLFAGAFKKFAVGSGIAFHGSSNLLTNWNCKYVMCFSPESAEERRMIELADKIPFSLEDDGP